MQVTPTENGYVHAEDVKFMVDKMGEVQKLAMKDGVPMRQLVVKKTDAEDKIPLANVEFELKNKETGEVVGKLTTAKERVAISELLPVGIAVLAIVGIGIVLWRLRRTKR